MPADFPVPRSEIPRVDVSPEEYLARKMQMSGMVDRLVQEFEEYSDINCRHINLRRWKQVASKERCKLYKERPKYQTSAGALGPYQSRKNSYASWRDDGSDDSYDGPMSVRSYDGPMSTRSYDGPMSTRSSSDSIGSNGSGGGARVRSRRAPTSLARTSSNPIQHVTSEVAESLKSMLMIGERPGRLEDAMHALVARNHEELAFVVVFLHKDVADCSILATLESPTEEEPYRYMGYKWFVKPSPTSSLLVKNRDSLYVEYTGITQTRSGETVGFHIMHAIDIPGFPDFHDRNCLRASQSISTLYYQKEENMVEIFLMGNVDIGGTVGVSPMAGFFAADTLFGMPRSIDCGEAKRLSQLVHERRRQRAGKGDQKHSTLCRLCRSEKKSFNMVSLVTCEICSHTVCTKCRVHKKVFESDGILGKFNKFNCCKTCVVDIENMHLPPAKPSASLMRKQSSAFDSNRGLNTRRHWSNASATLYEEEAFDCDVPNMRSANAYKDTASRGKLSVASTVVSTVPSDTSNSISMPEDDLTYVGPKSISESSEFDRSFAIVSKSTANYRPDNRETTSRDTIMSTDTFYDDDWSTGEAVDDHAVVPAYPAVGHHPGHHYDHYAVRQTRSLSQDRGRSLSQDRSQRTPRAHHHHHLHQHQPQPQYYSNHRGGAPMKSPALAQPRLDRHYSGGSNKSVGSNDSGTFSSREDIISRMQHLSMMAEATYKTTRNNKTMLKKQPLENRGRFFYY